MKPIRFVGLALVTAFAVTCSDEGPGDPPVDPGAIDAGSLRLLGGVGQGQQLIRQGIGVTAQQGDLLLEIFPGQDLVVDRGCHVGRLLRPTLHQMQSK